ncbi:alpha/beta hydrolase [uncultured Aquitalea sp.]|uniref:RBBP9/YdeN family alpha/beta hydrolase n=1 Tax=uncultured Aquitalea sp. TaxID=540272 RepID=UPI0025F93D69|nr:alpha/beta hydrolase [uncultured Aquitalea sp.]
MTRLSEDFDYIIQPGWRNSGPTHWQSHWADKLNAIRVQNDNWETPQLEDWLHGLDRALDQARRPAIVIAHSLGCIATAHYALRHPRRIAGALLVAPADVERAFVPRELMPFAPLPRLPLPFPALVAASDTDPFCQPPRSARLAGYWGCPIRWLPGAGHINVDSGHHQWEDGFALLEAVNRRAALHRQLAA